MDRWMLIAWLIKSNQVLTRYEMFLKALTAAEVVHRRLDGCCLHTFEIHAGLNRLELPA